MDVRVHSTLSEGNIPKDLDELVIVIDGELDEPRLDRLLFVISRSIAGKFQNLCAEIFDDSGHVDAGADIDLVVDIHRSELTLDSMDRKIHSASDVNVLLLSLAPGLHRSHLGHLCLRFS